MMLFVRATLTPCGVIRRDYLIRNLARRYCTLMAYLHHSRLAFAALLATLPYPVAAERRQNVAIFLVGDSTMTAATGWGGSFCDKQISSGTRCIDLAQPGRSSKSFRKQGYWRDTLLRVQATRPDQAWILIQFGHNDKSKRGQTTDPRREFPEILQRYVDEARAAGARVALITPLAKRVFNSGRIEDGLDPWAAAMRRTAEASGVILIDLHRESAKALEQLGPAAAQTLGPPQANMDNTHLGPRGADYFAAMVARLLRSAGSAFPAYVWRR